MKCILFNCMGPFLIISYYIYCNGSWQSLGQFCWCGHGQPCGFSWAKRFGFSVAPCLWHAEIHLGGSDASPGTSLGNRQTFSCPQHHVRSRQDLVLFSKGHHFGTVATVLTVVNTLLPRTLTSPMRFQCECHVRHGLVVQSLIICGPFGSWRGFSKFTMLHRSWRLPWPIIYSCKWSVPSPRLGNSLTKLQFSHLPALCRVKLKPGASCTIASGMHMLIIWVKYGIPHLKSSYVDGIPSAIN